MSFRINLNPFVGSFEVCLLRGYSPVSFGSRVFLNDHLITWRIPLAGWKMDPEWVGWYFLLEHGDFPVANCQFFQRANDAFFGVWDMKKPWQIFVVVPKKRLNAPVNLVRFFETWKLTVRAFFAGVPSCAL